MKATKKSKVTLVATVCALSLLTMQANASGRSFDYESDGNDLYTRGVLRQATAACTTLTTNKPLPTYVCCKLVKRVVTRNGHYRWHTIWRNTWVEGTCANANPYAIHDSVCGINSPVYSTGEPILGNCQFSTIKNKHLYYGRCYSHRYHHRYYGCGYRYRSDYGLE